MSEEKQGALSVHDFEAARLDGQPQPLSAWRGQVLLIVNTASECAFTPQYTQLEALYRRLQPQGFAVLGFPCNQFGNQEPGSEADIDAFCSTRYSVSFPMFAKVAVNGEHAHPLFRHLRQQAPGLLGDAIRWNFTKFLVDRHGRVRHRYAPVISPRLIENAIRKLLRED